MPCRIFTGVPFIIECQDTLKRDVWQPHLVAKHFGKAEGSIKYATKEGTTKMEIQDFFTKFRSRSKYKKKILSPVKRRDIGFSFSVCLSVCPTWWRRRCWCERECVNCYCYDVSNSHSNALKVARMMTSYYLSVAAVLVTPSNRLSTYLCVWISLTL